MYMYICICICIYVYMYMYICICIYVYVYMYMYICICIYVYVYVYVCVCVCIHVYIYMYICIYIYTYTYMCVCMCMRSALCSAAFDLSRLQLSEKHSVHHAEPSKASCAPIPQGATSLWLQLHDLNWPKSKAFSDGFLQAGHGKCLHDSLCRLCLYHNFLAKHDPFSCFLCWLILGLDHA